MPDSRAADIVDFWRSVELFDPPKVPARTRPGPGVQPTTFDLPREGPLPWQTGHDALARDPGENREWQFVVYGGLLEMQGIRREVERVLGRGRAGEERGSSGEAAMFAFVVGADGFLVEDSAALSSSVWAVGRLRTPGPSATDWLDGFDDEQSRFVTALNALSTTLPERPTPDPAAGKGDTPPTMQRVARAVGRRATGALADASNEGMKSVGGVVTGITMAAVAGVAGPVVGGYVGVAAGKFVERLLTVDRKASGGVPDQPKAEERGAGRPPATTMTIEYLDEFVRELAVALTVHDSLAPSGIRVEMRSVPVKKSDQRRSASTPVLSSFIREDLARVARALRAGDAGPALLGYLTPDTEIDTAGRVDVGRDRAAALAAAEPAGRPAGRWPVKREQVLSLGQQVAVNRIMADLADDAGVSTVNGPPGTGKTTLLRDVVAAILVQRAERLASLDRIEDAFTGSVSYRDAGRDRWFRTLRSDLTGAEIVLATNSNKAAANVTEELPQAKEPDITRLRSIDFYPHLAEQLLKKQAWALVAATLGNMANRRTFSGTFWWSEPPEAAPGLQSMLNDVVEEPAAARQEWVSARDAFASARAEVERATAMRQEVVEALRRCRSYPERRARCVNEEQAADARLTCSEDGLREADRRADGARFRLARIEADIAAHDANRPTLWARIVSFGQASRLWRERNSELVTSRTAAVEVEIDSAETCRNAATAAVAARSAHDDAQRARRVLDESAARDGRTVEAGRRRWPENFPDDGASEVSIWADTEFEVARATLCEAALRLHRTFVLAAAKQMLPALRAADKIIKGKRVNREVARAAWQAFFLVVPVASTTFASLPRLFADLGREDVGWILVDEAGQATQQSVVGGMWRARRAVLVGDPLQLEPIVPLPVTAQVALADRYRVDHQWLPDRRSAQVAADRLTRYGTAVQVPDNVERMWVGAPLRVHRRCDRPMFDISNDVAYANSPMVFATRPDEVSWRPSQWIDVEGPDSGNVVRAEVDELSLLVSELLDAGCTSEKILVITPFRAVADAAVKKLSRRVSRTQIGTVHTVQGKEAPVVILVLGGGQSARDWVASRPNLLNVAVSRAQNRLYIIGDRSDWKRRRYFDVAAKHLKHGPSLSARPS